jgi:hypothetical protein
VRALDRRWAATDWGGGRYVSLYDLICPDRCRHLTRDGVPYMTDYGHYTDEAGREIVADLADLADLAESYLAGMFLPPRGKIDAMLAP